MKPFLRILLPAAVCGLLLGACTQRQTTLKFMSYNIRNGRGIDNVQDLGRVAEIINRTAPDIVALQELDYDGGAYGVGLLSRDEPLAVRRIPLPGREESRVLFVAEFPDYVVCVTHLSLTPEDQRASLPIIRTVTDTCRKPVLLAGDFNMKVAKTVLDGLGGTFRPLSDTTQMTFPSDKPSIRIDYILGRGLPESAVVTERQVDTSTVASDHCPLWVSLAWKK